MTGQEHMENKLKQLGNAIGSDDSLVDSVMSRVDAGFIRQTSRARVIRLKRRLIMNGLTKFVAAAVIAVAAVLAVAFLHKSATPAYAIDQTVEALKNVRYMHAVRRDRAGNIEDERWVEIGPDGVQARYRQDAPERNFFVVDDQQTVMVHHPDKNTVILYDAQDKCWTWIYAPGKLFQQLADGGPDYYSVEENVQYKGQPAHHLRWVVGDMDIYIDPETKLPIAHGDYEISYEEPPEGTFDIVIPDGVVVVDKRPGAPPSEEPEWMIEERKKEEMDKVAQGYFEDARRALAAGNYAEAAELFTKTVEIQPGRNWAWFWMGIALYKAGDYDAAIYRLSKVIDAIRKHDLTIPSYQFARALAYQAKGMTDMAKLDMEKVLPKMIQALRNTRAAWSFDLADDPLRRADGFRSEECHEAPTKEQSLAMMINRLRLITGQNFGYDPHATDEDNEVAIAAWEAWLDSSGEIRFTPDAELAPMSEPQEPMAK